MLAYNTTYMFPGTFAMRARKRERTRNLNRSSSVCTMTSLKFADGSAVAFIISIASIFWRVAISTCFGRALQVVTSFRDDALVSLSSA